MSFDFLPDHLGRDHRGLVQDCESQRLVLFGIAILDANTGSLPDTAVSRAGIDFRDLEDYPSQLHRYCGRSGDISFAGTLGHESRMAGAEISSHVSWMLFT